MARTPDTAFEGALRTVRACRLCAADLPFEPRPILQVHPGARILIAGQAPGRRVNESGVPFQDPSGDRLRDWMGVGKEVFYDAGKISILPMGFCYPGTGTSGDLPPRPECADKWRAGMLALLPRIQLTLVIGQYAMDWHLKDRQEATLTQTVANWKAFWPKVLVLPHPSPRNNIWLKKNPWFATDVLPKLRDRVGSLLKKH